MRDEGEDRKEAPAVRPGRGISAGAGTLRNPVHLLACGLGLGLAPFAAGTFGTLLGIPLFLALRELPLAGYLGVVLVLFVLGVWLCEVTARNLRVHDHPAIVWDEVVGFLLTMTAAPPGWGWILLGFVVFRVFDIAKPWPIRAIDRRIGGGFGIMLDDLVGGFYGLLTLQVVHALLKTA